MLNSVVCSKAHVTPREHPGYLKSCDTCRFTTYLLMGSQCVGVVPVKDESGAIELWI